MQDSDLVAKGSAKPVDCLRSERDFRNKYDRCLSALVNDVAQELDIDQRFAATSDPVQKENLSLLRIGHRVDRVLLRGRGLEPRRRNSAPGRKRIALDLLFLDH